MLRRPAGVALLTILLACVVAGILAFLACFSVTRKAPISGVLLPTRGLIRIQPPQSGIVSDRRVHEGQSVKAGDILFVLASERSSATQGDAEAAVARLIQSRIDSVVDDRHRLALQSQQRIQSARQRVDDLAAEARRIGDQIALQRRRVDLAEQTLGRFSQLQRADYISAAGVQDKQAEWIDQQQRLADLGRGEAANARDRAAAGQELNDLRIQAERDQSANDRTTAAIQQDLTEQEARREVFIRAPQDGVVAAVAVDVGQATVAGQALATLLPADSALEAELYAPSRAAGFLSAGMDVQLRYQAYPYQKFGQYRGHVKEISSVAMWPADLSVPAAAGAPGAPLEPVYRVRVALDQQAVIAYGASHALKPGMALDASVLLERRHLYEWILEPLYSIVGRGR